MTNLDLTTIVYAPIQSCFDLSLDVEIEVIAGSDHAIRATGGIKSGIMRGGDIVTWEASRFGLRLRHTSLISGYEPPNYFQDTMLSGVFRSFAHDHYFSSQTDEATEMRDHLTFSISPFLLGGISERLFAKRRLVDLLTKRNQIIKSKAESGARPGHTLK